MQAQGYIGYGVYLNKKERESFAKLIIAAPGSYYATPQEVYEDSESYSAYMEQDFPELSVYVLDGYNYGVQFQDPAAVLAVYMTERMNYIGSETVDFSAPSQKAQDDLNNFLETIKSTKRITLIHWTAVEDN